MEFIQVNNKYINVKHISSITVLKDRVAFDMDTPIELDNGRLISFYAYQDIYDDDVVSNMLNQDYIVYNFIKHKNVLININHVISVKFIEKTNRIVVNLSHSLNTTYDGKTKLSSKFLYFDSDSVEEYNKISKKLKLKLNIKG